MTEFEENGPMSFAEYQRAAGRTSNPDLLTSDRITCALLGLTGESGECADLWKKMFFHGHGVTPDGRAKLRKELGDVMWYIAELCNSMDWSMAEVASENIEKLRARYPDRFTTAASVERADVRDPDIDDGPAYEFVTGDGFIGVDIDEIVADQPAETRWHMQTDLTPEHGDCQRACVASLLGLSMDEVPNFWDLVPEGQDPALGYGPQLIAWAKSKGFTRFHTKLDYFQNLMEVFGSLGQLVILSGVSPRGTLHSVIAEWNGGDWVFVHDPRPGGGFLSEVQEVSIWLPADPSLQ